MPSPSRSPRYRIGTASWTDPTLLTCGFYPATATTAETRLRYYATLFDTVEVDSTYYALPSERNAALWADRTPDGFVFHIKVFAALTQHPAETRALPKALRAELDPRLLRQPRCSIPSGAPLALCFAMFREALEPLRRAGKLGCLLFQFPPWFMAKESNLSYIDSCRAQLPDDDLAIEFRHTSWFGDRTADTIDFLRARRLVLVTLDAPVAPSIAHPPFVATAPMAYVRLHGRNRQTWFRHVATAAERFKYLYSDTELAEVASQIRGIGATATTNVIFNNCYADYGMRNARSLQRLLEGGT